MFILCSQFKTPQLMQNKLQNTNYIQKHAEIISEGKRK